MRDRSGYWCNAVLILFAILGYSCKKDVSTEVASPVPHAIKLLVPANFPMADEHPDNPLTLEGIELGRELFYDVRLSGSNRISCASCHRQNLAFTDGVALSNTGVSGKQLHRHAPALFNLAWSKSGLFWDGGAKNLESQAFGPLTSVDEMHQDLQELEKELKQVPAYLKQFKLAFNQEISSANVVKALAQFQRTLISGESKYDHYKRGENSVSLTTMELEGLKLVENKCNGCHSGELFTDDLFHNNGLDHSFSDEHEGIFQGRFRVSFNPQDMGRFKTPSLRNVMLTGPYMHDGRFDSIDQVLDHYQTGIEYSPTTDLLLHQNQGQPGIPLSGKERVAIKAFLTTLTDYKLLINKKIGNPNE